MKIVIELKRADILITRKVNLGWCKNCLVNFQLGDVVRIKSDSKEWCWPLRNKSIVGQLMIVLRPSNLWDKNTLEEFVNVMTVESFDGEQRCGAIEKYVLEKI